MTNKSPVRAAADIDDTVLNYSQIKALASDNPKIKEKIDLDIEVNKLRLIFADYQQNKRKLQNDVFKVYPEKIKILKNRLEDCRKDMKTVKDSDDKFIMNIKGNIFTDKKEAGTAITKLCQSMKPDNPITIGKYKGFDMSVEFNAFNKCFNMSLKNNLKYKFELGFDAIGNITRINNALNNISDEPILKELKKTENMLNDAKNEINMPFDKLDLLEKKEARLAELNKELSLDNNDSHYEKKETSKQPKSRNSLEI